MASSISKKLFNQSLRFVVPICEAVVKDSNKDVTIISGTAISATTTRNGHTFLAEELEKSAATLKNKPILKDHINSVDSIVGRTTENIYFDSVANSIQFEARIVDKEIQQKINDGLIDSVSVGAMVTEIDQSDDEGTFIARGIEFVELSLVAVPADPNANFAMALMEKYETHTTSNTKMETETKVEEQNQVQEEAFKVPSELKEKT